MMALHCILKNTLWNNDPASQEGYSICRSVYPVPTTINAVSICDMTYESFTAYINLTVILGGNKLLHFCMKCYVIIVVIKNSVMGMFVGQIAPSHCLS